MANTLTNLIPTVIKGLDVVSREQVGFIPSVNRDATADRLAKNQTLYSWVTPSLTLSDITPANVSPQASDVVLTTKTISITNFKVASFYFTGEEEKALGQPYGNIVSDLIEQAFRAITNQIETDIYTVAQVAASRAYGTVGTIPFTTNVGESAQIFKILQDNGAPLDTRSLVIDTTVGAQLRTLLQLTKANEAGTTMTLRDGELLSLNRLSLKESAAIVPVTAGTAASATTNNAGYAVGATVLTLASAGTGTILAGDVITFAGDSNKYVVTSGDSDTSNGGTITIAAPGLRVAMSAATKAITMVATSSRCLGFSRNAITLATRLPARNSGGDGASDVQTVVDSRSGMNFELAMYPQYRQVRYEIAAAWGVTAIKPEHIAALIY